MPVFHAAFNVIWRGAGLHSKESVGEISPVVVHLGRKVIGFRLGALADQFGVFLPVVQVVGQGARLSKNLRTRQSW
jgi:hypothetical protein